MTTRFDTHGRTRRIRCSLGLMLIAAVPAIAAAGDSSVAKCGAKRSAPPERPALIVVKFHADWCRACTEMDKIYADLVRETRDLSMMFVTLDLTNDTTRRQAEYLAASLGLDTLWSAPGNRVGTIKIVQADTKAVVSTVGASGDLPALAASLRRLAAARPDKSSHKS